MELAAGEYGYESFYFRRMLEAQAIDVLQADATRCCGITGFLRAAALADAARRRRDGWRVNAMAEPLFGSVLR